ncbi:MAG: hypothetical protein FJ405_19505 [Verrucomicrobia bacterium]|nr:hypothetical protein [Verrucomicrobiota bacterium]
MLEAVFHTTDSRGDSVLSSLQIERAGEAVRIAWPAALVDFVLESSPDLQPGSWSMVSQYTEVTAGMSVTTLPAPGSQQFFRLRKL